METYRIEHYVIEVEMDGKKPGETVNVAIYPERQNVKHKSVYGLALYEGDNASDLASRAFAHYKAGILPDNNTIGNQRGIVDETGCRRYTMTFGQLQDLYKKFEDFVADCTQQEYNENKSAIIAVYSLIHKHINNEIFQ